MTKLQALDIKRGPGSAVVDCQGQGQARGNEGLLLVVRDNDDTEEPTPFQSLSWAADQKTRRIMSLVPKIERGTGTVN